MSDRKRVFVASMATECNTFSPVFADLENFHTSFYYPAGKHPAHSSLCSGPFLALRDVCQEHGWELIEGSASWAEPAGLLRHGAYEHLRDEILGQLEACLPVDAVVLGLHGSMMTQFSDDPEGELLERARQLVGPDVVVAASYDPHGHLNHRREVNADLMVLFREFPHTDFLQRAHDLAALVARQLNGEIKPTKAVFDCRMIEVMPTSREPLRSFVDRIKRMVQDDDGILDISINHGFLAGDNPDMGCKMLVITNDDQARADALAKELGMELFALRGQMQMTMTPMNGALAAAAANESGKPLVVADMWDNPGGGMAGDDTRMLTEIISREIYPAALGPLWDPQAVKFCFAAGEGARIDLRFGAKCGAGTGMPIDANVEVLKLDSHATQSFGQSIVEMNHTALIKVGGVQVVLTQGRAQAFGSDLFSNMGVDLLACKLIAVKSTNHFYASFALLSDQILYATWPENVYPVDARKTDYKKMKRSIWPRVEMPHPTD